MHSDVLRLGDKIDVTHLDKYGRPAHNSRTYASRLIDFVDSDVFHISTPISSSTPVILNVGENYRLCFFTDKGLYQSDCVVLKNVRENNILIVVVHITTELEKFQRRQYYRLECIQEMKYHVYTSEEKILLKKIDAKDFRSMEESFECKKKLEQLLNVWIPAIMKDISGGGVRFTSEMTLSLGDKLQLKLDLVFGAGIKTMLIEAIVIATSRIYNQSVLYEHRIEFIDINKKDREDLIKYIFEQDRKRRINEKK